MHEVSFPKVERTSVSASKRVLLVDLRGAGATGDDENAVFSGSAESLQPLGFVARPRLSAELEACVVSDGLDDLVLCLVDKSLPPLTGLEEGETRVYGLGDVSAMIRIKANGSICVLPKAGQRVYVGAETGTQPLALGQALQTFLGSLKTWLDAHVHTETGGTTTVPTLLSPAVPTITATAVEGV